jgi:hypothetical protein
VHAPLVFLNDDFAFRTWLSIKLHPDLSVILTLVNSVLPFRQLVACNRSVGALQALKAPVVATRAHNVSLLH